MNKSLVFILILLIAMLLLACQNKELNKNIGVDRDVNIVSSKENIKTLKIESLSDNFKLEDIIDTPFNKALIMGELGETRYIKEGYFKRDKGSLSYID